MSEIVIYQSESKQAQFEVQFDKETVWLSQAQISELFERDQSVISRHIHNVFKEAELDKKSNMQKMHIANSDKPVAFYSLDVIISVGYRVKSVKGTQFRIWANRILKDFLAQGYAVNEKRLKESQKQLREFKKLVKLQGQVTSEYQLATDETEGLIQVIANYATALDLLDNFDHQRLELLKKGSDRVVKIKIAKLKMP